MDLSTIIKNINVKEVLNFENFFDYSFIVRVPLVG